MSQTIPITMTRKNVEILSEETLYKGFFQMNKYRLRHRLFSGKWSSEIDRELLVRYRVAAALPYDPKLDKVVLLEQFRHGALEDENSPWLIELVAGIMTKKEPLEKLARRETQEEAGLAIQDLLLICDYWSTPGGSSERVKLFCAKVDSTQAGGTHGLAEEHEDIKVHVFDSKDAFAAVKSGRINNAATIIALQWLELNKTTVRKQWRETTTS